MNLKQTYNKTNNIRLDNIRIYKFNHIQTFSHSKVILNFEANPPPAVVSFAPRLYSRVVLPTLIIVHLYDTKAR